MVARIDASVEVYDPEVAALRARTTSRTTTTPRLAVVSPRAGVQAETTGATGSAAVAPEQAAVVDTRAVEPAAASAGAGTPSSATTPAPAAPLPAAPPGVSEQWAQDRRAAMEEVRAEYRAARGQAERSGQFMRTETQADESGSYEIRVFDEAAFRAHWQAQAQGSLGVLAGLYGLDQGSLVGGRSDVIDLAIRGNVGLYEGRAPDGYVMADAAEIADLDAYLYSDMNQVLVLQFGTEPVAPATSGLAQEQVRKYGQARYEMLARLEQAQARIQRDYADALAQARNDPSRQAAGWGDVQVQVQVGGVADESGHWLTPPETRTVTERRFDVQAFSTWYVSQPQVSNQAFGAMYGIGHEVEVPGWADESGNAAAPTYEVRFTVQLGGQSKELVLQGNRIVDADFVHVNLNSPPKLHDGNGVFWHPLLGWSTHNSNIDRGRDWFETIVTIVVVAVAAYFTGGYAASFFAQGSLAAAVAGGAAAGATASAVSGVVSGNFSWSNVLRGAALGAVGGAVANGVTSAAQSVTDSQVVSALQDSGQVVAEGTNVSQVVNGTYQVNAGALGLEANSSLIADAQATFRVARTVGQVAQGGLMAELGGGDFEDGALSALGTAIGQNAGAQVTQALGGGENPLVSADVARFAGGVVGAGVSSAWVNERGGDGDLSFVNGVVDSAVNMLPEPPTREQPQPTWSSNPEDYAGLEDAFGPTTPAGDQPTDADPSSTSDPDVSVAPPEPEPAPIWSNDLEDYRELEDAFGWEESAPTVDDPANPSSDRLNDAPAPGVTSDSEQPTLRERIAQVLGVDVDDIHDVSLQTNLKGSIDFLLGLVEGSGISILSSAESLVALVKDPAGFAQGVHALLTSSEARAALGEHAVQSLESQLRELQAAWDAGDMRMVGQHVGKLSTDLAQVATGVAGLGRAAANIAGSAGRLANRALGAVEDLSLLRQGGIFAADGRPLLDFRDLTTAQKGIVGELLGSESVARLVPNGTRIGRAPAVPGRQGIDDIFRVGRADVDYVIVEYKFGSSRLGATADGIQMSDDWLLGTNTGYNRIADAVGDVSVADSVTTSLAQGRVERWVVHTDPFGKVTVGMLDAQGRFIVRPNSALLRPGL